MNKVPFRARAPMRISFGGGGTDLSPYVEEYGGVSLSTTIDLFAMSSMSLMEGIPKLSFHCAETSAIDVLSNEQIMSDTFPDTHDSTRISIATLKILSQELGLELNSGIEVQTASDAPVGSGLGASSVLAVSCVTLYDRAFKLNLTKKQIASFAFRAERELLGLAGGKQDHFASAYGGFNLICYEPNGSVEVEPIILERSQFFELQASLLLIYTGTSRDSGNIIEEQRKSLIQQESSTLDALHEIKALAFKMREALMLGNIKEFGKLLNRSWEVKKGTARGISSESIENLYQLAMNEGAIGGKISGAGGGGFMLLVVPPSLRFEIERKLLREGQMKYPFQFELSGSIAWRSPSLENGGGSY